MEKKFQKWIIEDERGKRPGQKLKSLPVMQCILKNAGDAHAVTIGQIEDNPSVPQNTKNPGCMPLRFSSK